MCGSMHGMCRPPGDWPTYYRQKLPFRAILVGKSKGRTIRAMRERCNALLAQKTTRTEGLILQKYLEQCKRVNVWRGGQALHGLSEQEYDSDIRLYIDNGVILPAIICQNMVARASGHYSTQRDWKAYLLTVLPFGSLGEASFDYQRPMLKDLPRVLQWRIQASITAVCDDFINQFLFEGPSAAAKVESISRIAIEILEEQDPILMDTTLSEYLEDLKTVFEALLTITTMPLDPSGGASIQALLIEPLTKDMLSGPIMKVRAAFEAAEWYADRANQYMAALPTLIEKRADFEKHLQVLEDFEASEDNTKIKWTEALTTAVEELSQALDKLPGDAMKAPLSKLCAAVKKNVEHWIQDFGGDKIPIEDDINIVSKLLQAASIAWPFDDKFAESLMMVQGVRDSLNSSKMLDMFMRELQKHLAASPMTDAFFDLGRVASTLSGLTLPRAGLDAVEKLLGMGIAYYLEKHDDAHSRHEIVKTMDELIRFLRGDGRGFQEAIDMMGRFNRLQDVGTSFLGGSTEDLELVQKAVIELSAGIQKQPQYEGLTVDLVTSFKALMQSASDTFGAKVDEVHMAMLVQASGALDVSIKDLANVASGSSSSTTPWDATLVKSSSMDMVKEAAIASGLLRMDIPEVEKKMNVVNACIQKLSIAEDLAGLHHDNERVLHAQAVLLRATLSIAASKLVALANMPPSDADQLRVAIQEEVLRIRSAGGSEKEHLPTGLYNWLVAACKSRVKKR